MSNPSVLSLQLAAAVANGIILSASFSAGSGMTPGGSLAMGGVATLDVPRRVIVTSVGNDSANTFWISGTDRNGNAIWEALPGANAGVAQTVNDFATVSQVITTLATASTVTVGTDGTASSPWVLDNFLAINWALSVWCSVVSGAATYTVEDTPDDPNTMLPQLIRLNPLGGPHIRPPVFDGVFPHPSLTPQPQQYSMEPASFVPAQAWANPFLTNQTTNAMASYADRPVFAHRLTITAGTGLVAMQSIQSGIL